MKNSFVVNIGRLNLDGSDFNIFDPIEIIHIISDQFNFNFSTIKPFNEVQLRHQRAFFTLIEQFFFQFPMNIFFFKHMPANNKKKKKGGGGSPYQKMKALKTLEEKMLKHPISGVKYYRADHLKYQFFTALHYYFNCTGYYHFFDYEYFLQLVSEANRMMNVLFGLENVPYLIHGDESKIKLFLKSLAKEDVYFYQNVTVAVNRFSRLMPSLIPYRDECGHSFSGGARAVMPAVNKERGQARGVDEGGGATLSPKAPSFKPGAVTSKKIKLNEGQLFGSCGSTASLSPFEQAEFVPNKEEREECLKALLKSSQDESSDKGEAKQTVGDLNIGSLSSVPFLGMNELSLEEKNAPLDISKAFSPQLKELFDDIKDGMNEIVLGPESDIEEQKEMFLSFFQFLMSSLRHLTDVNHFFNNKGKLESGGAALSCLYLLQAIPPLRDSLPESRAFQFLMGHERGVGILLIPELEGLKAVLQSMLRDPLLSDNHVAIVKGIVTRVFLNDSEALTGDALACSKQCVSEIIKELDNPDQLQTVIDLCVSNLTTLVKQAELEFSAQQEGLLSIDDGCQLDSADDEDAPGVGCAASPNALTLSALEGMDDIEPVDMQAGRLAQFLGVDSDVFYKQLLGKFNFHGDIESRADSEASSIATAMFDAPAVGHAELRMMQRKIAPGEVAHLCKKAHKGRAKVSPQGNGRWKISQYNGPLNVITTQNPQEDPERFSRGRVVTVYRSPFFLPKPRVNPRSKLKRIRRHQRKGKAPNLASMAEFPSPNEVARDGSAEGIQPSSPVSPIENLRMAFNINKDSFTWGDAPSPLAKADLQFTRSNFPGLSDAAGSASNNKK